MPTIDAGRREEVSLQEGKILTITPAAGAMARLTRQPDSQGTPAQGFQTYALPTVIGSFPVHRTYAIEALGAAVQYTITKASVDLATQLGNVEGFTGNRTLCPDDNGKILRCDDGSNVTVTVPSTLPQGFNVGLALWGAGTVTVAAGSGATKRSSTSALSTQYQLGGLLVMKNTDNASAEFKLSGDFA